jgi:hypothetical protein
MLRNTWTEVEYWLDVSPAARGANVKIYKHSKISGEILHFSSQKKLACNFSGSEVIQNI